MHLHQHLSSFQRCLLLQTLLSSIHLHLQVSCYSMCLVLLVLDIKLNTLTFYNIRNTQFCIWIVDIMTTTTAFTCFNTKRRKHRFFTININNLWFYFAFLIVHWKYIWMSLQLVNYNQNHHGCKKTLFNKSKHLILCHSFS